MSKTRQATLISIAGFDPTGGAGILLDAAVFARLGFRSAGVVSALTAQNADRVAAVQAVPAAFLKKQYATMRSDNRPVGIKVGMLGSAANLVETARILGRESGIPRVVDPVLRSSSGRTLLEKTVWPSFLKILKGRMTLITPNLDEAAQLSGLQVSDRTGMKEAARRIGGQAECACLLKGGHLQENPLDILWDGRIFEEYGHEKIEGDAHGTGCFLSSAVLGFLARGETLAEACRKGIDLTHEAIRKAILTARPPDTAHRSFLL
ncbi:MAG: hydroxymethylpyrimidine/phosphomethylpyrimidine kinase [Acidobacteriota bacterium]|nr:hydroxymethylpyrimidine/phosphomethylpyrimidine kinase [Acidobacteriota bacterium]